MNVLFEDQCLLEGKHPNDIQTQTAARVWYAYGLPATLLETTHRRDCVERDLDIGQSLSVCPAPVIRMHMRDCRRLRMLNGGRVSPPNGRGVNSVESPS